MAPFTDAVGFVDSDAGQFPLRMDYPQDSAKVIALTKFRGDVE